MTFTFSSPSVSTFYALYTWSCIILFTACIYLLSYIIYVYLFFFFPIGVHILFVKSSCAWPPNSTSSPFLPIHHFNTWSRTYLYIFFTFQFVIYIFSVSVVVPCVERSCFRRFRPSNSASSSILAIGN